MADYFTQEVLTHGVFLTRDLIQLLETKGAEVYLTGDEGSVLDGLVDGEVLKEGYITFENGWNEYWETFDEYVDEGVIDEETVEETSDYVKTHFGDSRESILLEILKLNPELDHIEMQSSWSCSKMRLDGFGGNSLIVTRKGFLYITTTNFEITEDGEVIHRSEFTPWPNEDEEKSREAA